MGTLGKPGYPDYQPRIPPGWRIAIADQWPINTNIGPTPQFDIKRWRFETYGAVKKPLSLAYDDVLRLPHVMKVLDHHCVDGWSYLGHEWTGVEIDRIFEMTHPTPDAKYLLVEAENGMSQTFPLGQEFLLVYKRNGQTLPRQGGYPLRVVAPGQFGYKSVKWVGRIKFTVEREPDFWDRKFMEWGLPPIPDDLSPWNCDNKERKRLLRELFTRILEDRRNKTGFYEDYMKSFSR